jgi:hypothetical protein
MYSQIVKLTATEFRKNLFGVLERALRGETIEVQYKGATVKLVPAHPASKLARAKRQHALLCEPDAIIHGGKAVISSMEAGWRQDWSKL